VLNRAIARSEIRPDVDYELVTELLIAPTVKGGARR
jgi:hypothetical protein